MHQLRSHGFAGGGKSGGGGGEIGVDAADDRQGAVDGHGSIIDDRLPAADGRTEERLTFLLVDVLDRERVADVENHLRELFFSRRGRDRD